MKKILILLVGVFLFLPCVKAENLDLAPNAKSALLMEFSTGEILYQKDIHTKYAPASMTKIMSMLLFVEAIEKGSLRWDEEVKVSEHASSMGGSQIFLEVNETMTVNDLFKGIAIGSANDATVALAERVGGTEDNFVEMMNNRAKELGLKNTNFKNASGLDEANHYSTAYDMSIIAKELIKHKKILEFTSIYETYLRENTDQKFWLVNTNKLVRFYDGVDGLKTGYTDEAGYCLTATAMRNDMRLIAIVFGEEDSKIRNNDISKMLDYGYNTYEIERVLSNNSVVDKIEIIKGKKKYVDVIPVRDVTILYKKGEKKKNVTYTVELNKIKAPVLKGDDVGLIKVKDGKKVINKVSVTVKESVEKANIIELYGRYLLDILKGDINI